MLTHFYRKLCCLSPLIHAAMPACILLLTPFHITVSTSCLASWPVAWSCLWSQSGATAVDATATITVPIPLYWGEEIDLLTCAQHLERLWLPLQLPGNAWGLMTLILDFQLPDYKEIKFLLCKPHSLWYFHSPFQVSHFPFTSFCVLIAFENLCKTASNSVKMAWVWGVWGLPSWLLVPSSHNTSLFLERPCVSNGPCVMIPPLMLLLSLNSHPLSNIFWKIVVSITQT